MPLHEQVDHVAGRQRIRQNVRAAGAAVRGRFGPLVRFALSFEVLRGLFFAPLAAGLLRLSLEHWGRCSVGNFEIIAFILSPAGLVALLGIGAVGLTTFYLETAGLMLLLADDAATWWGVYPALGKRLVSLLKLGLRQIVILVVLAAPFLAAAAGILKVLWAGSDLNGLLVLKPPVFWIGAVAGASLLAGWVLVGGYFVLRWLVALPIVLFEFGAVARKALQLSTDRLRGGLGSLLGLVLAWLAALVLLSALLMGGLRFGSELVLDSVGVWLPLLLPVTALVVILHGAAAALLSVISSGSLAALVLLVYRETGGLPPAQRDASPVPSSRPARLPARRLIAGGAAVLLVVAAVGSAWLVGRVELREHLEITAHRGGAALAPENTIAAIRSAIAAGADWAEIDVQRTADGALVIVHDSDLVRVGGVQRRVAESTLAEIQSVDVGSRFSAAFAGERVPTLDALLAAAGDRIRLNIELKPNGPSDVEPLVRGVLAAVQRAGITDRCRLCSQSYEGLQLARQIALGLELGYIAGAQLGDLSRLDVDFLMVSQRLATRKLADTTRIRGMEVHAWTINDPDALVPLLDRGIANIITDEPAAFRRRLGEVQNLSPAERLLLRVRNLLAD
ncbi:MAG: glycerophosphodiester phosphodiesterase family protein [Planctomycetota bacterium]